ncbi:PREDICTED: putative pentatricopeptide repeat-containing protein At3g05240 [Tarenaya hassleriana]|uniref:putative pentatricopeptide repeat-containing protein At3g05240 n=1 Tax=Tarenaya hassleriana TaxID=28532 RepID=UPI00053C40C5|nr:PREDICTED: putative pentatricopeptide repeat-containing protein At3g05240 [Tarenaya hassleriana]
MKKHYNTVLSLLENCRTMVELKQIHSFMIKTSVIEKVIPLSKLIDFCTNSETGNLSYATSLFESIDHPSVYIWNSMIRGYSENLNPDKALIFYREMLRKGYLPDHFTFPFVLKACSGIKDVVFGRCVHGYVAKTGFEANMYVSTCLLHMYMCCREVERGMKIFEGIPKTNAVAWGSLISGFVNNNLFRDAIQAFTDMQGSGVRPNEMIMADLLVACGRIKDIQTGKRLHNLTQELGFDPFTLSGAEFNVILATCIIDMYGRCGDLRTARYLFDEMPQRNLVSWNAIITSYSQSGNGEEAFRMFSEMQATGFMPDKVTFLSLIRASMVQGNTQLGQSIHGYVLKTGAMEDTAIICALVDMYAKTGDNPESAKRVFEDLKKKDAIAWTVMIMGLASHGHGEEALRVFERMQEEGRVSPDEITYVGVLYACSHSGLVEEGRKHFAEMRSLYRIEPAVEHYGCMVDILSRAGQFEEAERLVQTMPVQANANIWGALLNGCEIHENVDLADRVRSQMTTSEDLGSGIYVLLSNIFAKAGRWYDVKLVRESMKSRRIAKVLANSSVETVI